MKANIERFVEAFYSFMYGTVLDQHLLDQITYIMDIKVYLCLKSNLYTVESVLVAAASNHFDEMFDQNLLSKKWILLRLLFEGGFYLRAASNTDDTVCR